MRSFLNDGPTVTELTEKIQQPRLWRGDGWTARVIKNEDDDGWAVALFKDAESEPALVGPWTMGRDKKNPKPLDGNAFSTLVKTAREFVRRSEQQLHASLHQSITVSASSAGLSAVIASQPYPARYRIRTLNRDVVTASVARQSMPSEVMDCFTAFAMTATFTMTGLFMESAARQSTNPGSPRRDAPRDDDDLRETRITVCLDIVPDEDNPYALLSARDEADELLAEVRVAPSFKLNRSSAVAWAEGGFVRPAQSQ
jgi:hypothetical protein